MNLAPQELQLSITRWTNPTDKPVTVDLYTGTGVAKVDKHKNPSGVTRVTWEPGQTIELPSEFDDAIQKIDPSGQVVGGRAPMLLRNGQRHSVHSALDVKKTEAVTAAQALLEASKARAEAEAQVARLTQAAADSEEKLQAANLAEQQAVEAAKQRELLESQLELQRAETDRLRQQLAQMQAQSASAAAPTAAAPEPPAPAAQAETPSAPSPEAPAAQASAPPPRPKKNGGKGR